MCHSEKYRPCYKKFDIICSYTGGEESVKAHKYFAFGSLICMIMAVYSGHKMISGNKKSGKKIEKKEVEK